MDEIKEGIMFYNLGTQKIDFSKIQNYFNIDTSKPVIASKGFNKALKNVIDKDIGFLRNSLKKIITKVNKVLDSNCSELELEIDITDDNITSVKNKVIEILNKITEYKLKNKVGVFTTDKRNKKQKQKKLEECINHLNDYQKELISIEIEYNKLIGRKNKIGFEESETEDNKLEYEDPLERTINFYMTKDQKN